MTQSLTFHHPVSAPLSSTILKMPLAYYLFYQSPAATPATVYKDPYLKVPFTSLLLGNTPTPTCAVQADAAGNFPMIYVDPDLQYEVQLFNSQGVLQYALDPYIPPLPALGNRYLNVNPTTGEVRFNAPATGGSGIALAVAGNASPPGSIFIAGARAGDPLLEFLNTLTTGTATAGFAATNKPGTGTAGPGTWLPILGEGGITYYLPLFT